MYIVYGYLCFICQISVFQVVLFENPGRSISIKENNLKFIYFYNIDIQVILFVYIFSFFEKQNTEWTSEPQPEPPIPQTISVPPATPTQIQVPRTQKPPEPRQQSFRQQPPPMKVNVPRPKTPIKNGTVLKDLLYKLRKTVFRY